MDIEKLWKEIDARWEEIQKIIRANLETTKCIMLNPAGAWVDSNRPMMESIISDWKARSLTFIHYLIHAKIVSVESGSIKYVTTEKGREIHATLGSVIKSKSGLSGVASGVVQKPTS